jgi:hypothetical protein
LKVLAGIQSADPQDPKKECYQVDHAASQATCFFIAKDIDLLEGAKNVEHFSWHLIDLPTQWLVVYRVKLSPNCLQTAFKLLIKGQDK